MIAFHLLCLSTSMFWPYLFAFYATYITNRITFIGYSVYSTNWYDYPLDLQKYLILIIIRSQESVNFHGLNLIYCTMEVFGKVGVENIIIFSLFLRIISSDFVLALQNILLVLHYFPKFISTLIVWFTKWFAEVGKPSKTKQSWNIFNAKENLKFSLFYM